jgi:serine/threonine protein phosphatase PrpC
MTGLVALEVTTGSLTHKGMVRDHNEDSLLSLPETGLWVIADGMGGHQAGDVASRTIIDAAASVGRPSSAPDLQARFLDRLYLAHDRIRNHSQELGGATVGSTVVALLCHAGHFAAIWAGDSRLYRLRDGQFSQISTDHTEAQELLRQGVLTPEQAAVWPRRNVITRAVGVFDQPNPDQVTGELMPGDTFLLCSDGLTEHVSDEEIAQHLRRSADPQAACDGLVSLTLSRGARDNVSVIVVRLGPTAGPIAGTYAPLEAEKTVPGLPQPAGPASIAPWTGPTTGQIEDGG